MVMSGCTLRRLIFGKCMQYKAMETLIFGLVYHSNFCYYGISLLNLVLLLLPAYSSKCDEAGIMYS